LFHYDIVTSKRPVLLMARELGLGGSERQLAEIALALDRDRFAPHVGCFTTGGFRAHDLREAGVPILELGVRSLVSHSALTGAWRMGRYLRHHHIRLVHAFDVPLDLFAVPVARFFHTPVVLSSQRAHRALTPGTSRQLLRVTDRMVDGIVVNSRSVARELQHEDEVPPSMIRLAYNGVDTGRFHRDGPRASLPWTDATMVIGIICALRPEKGLPTLVEAFDRLTGVHPGVKLLIVGDGPMLDLIQSRCGPNCHFEPAQRDVVPWLRAIDIFVLPSLSEALSNSLMEAMSTGCCPVASDAGGNPELVEDGRSGLLFPAGDSRALAACLTRLLDDPPLRRRLADGAAIRMRTNFNRAAAARTMASIYDEYLGA
jgi:L-malate glycosyltransferase